MIGCFLEFGLWVDIVSTHKCTPTIRVAEYELTKGLFEKSKSKFQMIDELKSKQIDNDCQTLECFVC